MGIPPPVSLDDGWLAVTDDGREFAVPSLRAFAGLPDQAVRLARRFDVPPILEVCLSFELHFTASPDAVGVTINGWPSGDTDGQSFMRDVTDMITLEDNIIEMRVPLGASGVWGEVLLRAVPCAPVVD